MTEQEQYQRVKLGALWLNTSKNGKQYYSGKLEANIQMWPNNKRDGMKDPDFIIWASEKVKVANQSKLGAMDFGKGELYIPPKDGGSDVSDIPF